MFKFTLATAVAALPVAAQECGIGDFECTGEAFSHNGHASFANDHTVEALDVPGWWQVGVFAGGGAFAEYQYCTKDPEILERPVISPSTKLICVAGERTDMVDPSVRVTWFYKDCDTFTKVVQTGPAESTEGGTQTKAEAAQITCKRKSTIASSRRLRQPAPPALLAIPPRRVELTQAGCSGNYVCQGKMYTKPTSNATKLGEFMNTSDDEARTFNTLDNNWYGFDVTADGGSLSEKRLCTAWGNEQPSFMDCVTTSRSDQQNPTIFSRLQNGGCPGRFAEVVTLFPATKAGAGNQKSDPAIAFISCTQDAVAVEEEQVAGDTQAEEIVPNRMLKATGAVALQTCEPGEFVCESRSRIAAGETIINVTETIVAKNEPGWWEIQVSEDNAETQVMYCTRSAEATSRTILQSSLRCVVSTDRSVFVEMRMASDCDSYDKVTLAGGSEALIGTRHCVRMTEAAPSPTPVPPEAPPSPTPAPAASSNLPYILGGGVALLCLVVLIVVLCKPAEQPAEEGVQIAEEE